MFNSGLAVAVVLLVVLASVASFALSQWFARENKSRGWIAMMAGIVLLLTAAVIATLTMGSLALHPWTNLDPVSPSAGSSPLPRAHEAAESAARLRPHDADSSYGNASPSSLEAHQEDERSTVHSQQARPQATPSSQSVSTHSSRTALIAASPWDATACVSAYHRDPENLRLWTLENECGVPIAILIAGCNASPAVCDRQRGWEYRRGGMLLPARFQRTVTDREENQDGKFLRYAACRSATEESVRLIGMGTSADDSRFDALELERTTDPCLSRVYDLTIEGLGHGALVEALARYGAVAPRDDQSP